MLVQTATMKEFKFATIASHYNMQIFYTPQFDSSPNAIDTKGTLECHVIQLEATCALVLSRSSRW